VQLFIRGGMYRVNSDRHLLGTQPIGRLLFRLSLPSAIGMIVMSSYNVVDAIFIGRGVGSLGLAAVAVCFPLQLLAGAMAVMAGAGGASIISRSLGAGDLPRAQKAFGTTISFATGVGIIISILGLLFLPRVLRLFGASQAILPHAEAYLSVIFFGIPFQMFGMAGNHSVRAEGKAKISMISLLISAILNMILDPIFIFWFGWGMRGAAVATVISQMTMFAWIFSHFYRRNSLLHFTGENLVPDMKILREIIAIGASEFTRMAAGSLSIVLINAALLRWGGDMHVAIYGVINRALSFFFMPLLGIAQGFQPILGYNYGAGNLKRARKSIFLAMGSATVIAILGFSAARFFPRAIFGLFSSDENLISEGVQALRLISSAFVLVGFQINGSAMFQALGKARPAFILSLSRQVLLLIPLVLTLPNFFGTAGVWISFPIADSLAFCLTLYLFLRELRRMQILDSESA
jgi:putative MATE family efflux protein